MSYYATREVEAIQGLGLGATIPPLPPPPPRDATGTLPPAVGVLMVGGVVVVLGLAAFSIWSRHKIMTEIARKEGSKGALTYTLGEAGAGLLGMAAGHALAPRMQSNARRRRRRRA